MRADAFLWKGSMTPVSYTHLEWNGTKLVKALLASMDVSQEKKAEIESHKALKDAYLSLIHISIMSVGLLTVGHYNESKRRTL